jgi:2'-5' RNA ligase
LLVRLFVAIAFDQATRDLVVAERQRLMTALGTAATSMRPVSPDQLHLTLVFIGEVDDSCRASIAGRFAEHFERPAFALTLGGAGIFSAGGAPRVLWLGLRAGLEAVTDLQRLVVRRLSGLGLVIARKPFSPHLTLGRWRAGAAGVRLPRDRRIVSADMIRSALDGQRATNGRPRAGNGPGRADKAEHAIAEVMVNEVTLFQSRLSSAGSTYTALARARLS